jgi:hypothetical protein
MKKLWLGEFTKSKLDKEINNLYLIEYWIFYKYNKKRILHAWMKEKILLIQLIARILTMPDIGTSNQCSQSGSCHMFAST